MSSPSPEDNTTDQRNAVAIPNEEGKWSRKLKQHFKETFGTIFVKPVGRPPNLWKQLTMLNTRQRLTFLAGMYAV